ncbi:AraC family transcriptional regulator [Gayadomonas joobiniege]|uniref:AraC family transcriptional regulator n=1 Tax=Gayadomonas joobiniege TaxID=1234606 RepID=UPI00036899A2|nr:AraC family transcriptional regulator [Gayadomonas joobiniege]
MDILSDLLKSLQVSGSVYFCSQVEPPWHKVFANKDKASFHLLRQGRCVFKTTDTEAYLQAGDLVFVGPGVEHELISKNTELIDVDKNDNADLLLCGDCEFDTNNLSPLASLLNQVTIVRKDELVRHNWLKSTFDQISSEYMAQDPGAQIIVNKLTEVIMIELIRINFAQQQHQGFINALNDKPIKKALELMHQSPHFPWTIADLAKRVGLSRALFAKRFTGQINQTVFVYLTKLRVEKAKRLITTSTQSIEDIALLVGYESERAFNRTFDKYVGMTPKQYRKLN